MLAKNQGSTGLWRGGIRQLPLQEVYVAEHPCPQCVQKGLARQHFAKSAGWCTSTSSATGRTTSSATGRTTGAAKKFVRRRLLDVKEKTFKILAFRVIDVHGVVGRLVEAVKNPHAAAGLGGGGENREGEGLFVHDLRAAESEDKPAGGDLGDRVGVRRW